MIGMNQITSEIWEHSPSEIQVKVNPVKAVKKSNLSSVSLQTSLPTVSWEDLRGLSWTFANGGYDDYYDYEEE